MVSNEEFLLTSVPSLSELKKKVLPYREQERIQNEWLKERLETIMPKVMKDSGLDMWIVACNEYNEDPILFTLLPKALFTARRLTILVFVRDGETVKRLCLTRPHIGIDDYYEQAWVNQKGSNWGVPAGCTIPPETQFECLNRLANTYDPKKIGVNVSENFAFGDGLSHSLYTQIFDGLDKKYQDRLVSAEYACVKWLETRTDKEIAAYTGIMQFQHAMIAECFSSKVCHPGLSTNRDVKYAMMQSLFDMGLTPWFDFDCSIIRKGVGRIDEETVIMPGDMLHCDVGFRYMNLCTDTQELAYVCQIGETDAPEFLKKGMADVNRFRDICVSHFKVGATGNEILKASREEALAEGLVPSLYTHPIGNHGHAAGPTIGLTDMQGGVPVRGDYPLGDHTCYSLELNCTIDLTKEWGITARFGMETDIALVNNEVHYLAGRQTNFHLIK